MSNKLSIAKVAIPLPIDKLFDYYIPKGLTDRVQIGMRVAVRFNNKITTGYVISRCSKSKLSKLNPILKNLDENPILTTLALQSAEKIKDYYVCSLGEAIEAMLPNTLKRSKEININSAFKQLIKEKIKKGKIIYIQSLSNETVLNYFEEEIIKRIKERKRVIFVVPEIRMIKSTREYLSKIDDIKIGIWHGRLPKKKMFNLWKDLSFDRIDVIIGTRSCIFAPMRNLDLIIIKDESNPSYKGDQVPYYHAVKVAQLRFDIEKCDLILSSEIPSAETFQLISKKRVKNVKLGGFKSLANIQITGVNFRDKIDVMLEKEIESALEKKEKILVFFNRRGFATSIYCRKCKDTLQCNRCSSNLRFDYAQKILICPCCNFKTEAVEICPKCNSVYVKYRGLGIEKLESNIKRLFPQANIISTDELDKANNKTIYYDILIATKKILNFEEFYADITIIWDFDSLLNFGDFHSGEETYQLLAKLLLKTTKKMFISSSLNQDFYLLKGLRSLDFEQFYKTELKTRRQLKLPPYYHIALVSIRSLKKERTQSISSRLFTTFNKSAKKDIDVSKFYSPLRSRIREKYYSYLLVKSKNAKLLNRFIKKTIKKFRSNNVIITVKIDPI